MGAVIEDWRGDAEYAGFVLLVIERVALSLYLFQLRGEPVKVRDGVRRERGYDGSVPYPAHGLRREICQNALADACAVHRVLEPDERCHARDAAARVLLIEVHDFIAQARDKVDGLAAELREPLKVWPRDRHEVHPAGRAAADLEHFQRQAVLPCLYVFLHIAA